MLINTANEATSRREVFLSPSCHVEQTGARGAGDNASILTGRTERDQRGLSRSFVAPHPANVALNQAIIDALRRWQMENQWDGENVCIHFMDCVCVAAQETLGQDAPAGRLSPGLLSKCPEYSQRVPECQQLNG